MKILRLSNTQKWFALAVIIAAMYIAFWSVLAPQPTSQPTSQPFRNTDGLEIPSTQVFALIDSQQDTTAIEAEAALKTARELLTSLSADISPVVAAEVSVESSKAEAWQVDNHRAPTPGIPLNEKIEEYAIVEIDQTPAAYPQVGEEVVLPMLNGEKVAVDVKSSVTNPNGDYTWRGHLQGHGDSYPVVMTYGATSVMATITTPAGSYSMTTVKGLGWLYKNPAEVQLVDSLQNDFLEPPIHHYHDEH